MSASRGRLLPGEVSAPGGCLFPGGVYSSGGVSAPGVSAPGVSAPGGCLLGEVSAPRGCLLWAGGVCSGGGIPCEQNERQVQKYYLGHNFVTAGKNVKTRKMVKIQNTKGLRVLLFKVSQAQVSGKARQSSFFKMKRFSSN